MEDTVFGGMIVFGILLVIALFGLVRSSSAAARLNASTEGSAGRNTTYRPLENIRQDDSSNAL